MSSVLIRGMEMPDACPNCPFVMAYYCLLIGISDDNEVTNYINKRHPDCPLVEIPTPHGRLIDADAFKETIDYYIREAGWSDAHNEALGWVKEFIDNEQAVIEAEGSEE